MWEQHRLGEAASLIESLKSNTHLIIDARNGKNLTHLQSILLFKDSSRTRPGLFLDFRKPLKTGSGRFNLRATQRATIGSPSSRRLHDLINEDFCRLRSTVWCSHKQAIKTRNK